MSPSLAIHVDLIPKDGPSDALRAFLISGKPLINAEPGTLQWFCFKMHGRESYGIFNTFSNAASRNAHIEGEIRRPASGANAEELLAAPPQVSLIDIFAHKVTPSATGLTVGVHIFLKAKAGKTATLKAALAARAGGVEAEDFTPFWYAFQKEGADSFGQIAVFKSAKDRAEHISYAGTQVLLFEDLLEGPANICLFKILAYKI
ncbi:hypothetical protein FA95DRAFT_503985 [Auriscalpium vulgare]|uniref:Uncharacterized protein n=1 Tax=Auriscalpium vulgare TaxID=40419 RepID=A0ACB8RGD7_9AGAM|nr:hypothetical protein FA95DRAFT_503985 [Auriscalpium vulgare]